MNLRTVYLYGDMAAPIVALTAAEARAQGLALVLDPVDADLALAPLLEEKIGTDNLSAPLIGTLVFHPSLLPRYRGRNAVRAAIEARDTYTGVTWFWASPALDAGDVCEQEVIEIEAGETPRRFYERAAVPAAMVTLRRALIDLRAGHIRRRPQRASAAACVPATRRSI